MNDHATHVIVGNSDGERCECTLADFFLNNQFGFASRNEIRRALNDIGSFSDGGGASPEWTISVARH